MSSFDKVLAIFRCDTEAIFVLLSEASVVMVMMILVISVRIHSTAD
jgi:hypothetical protein